MIRVRANQRRAPGQCHEPRYKIQPTSGCTEVKKDSTQELSLKPLDLVNNQCWDFPVAQQVKDLVLSLQQLSYSTLLSPARAQGLAHRRHSINIVLFVCLLFRAVPMAYGSSQARGRIRPIAADLHHSHSSVGSEPCLQPTPQLLAMPDP